jgi:1-deoxy-D-xylulose-5-phosphate synthase
MLYTAVQQNGPTAVRYPRGAGGGVETVKQMTALPLGRGVVVRESTQPAGGRIAILAFGTMVAPALAAGEALHATVVNMRFVKPIDAELIARLAQNHDAFVTVEEGCIMGGAGSACIESMFASGLVRPVLQLGLPDQFIDHGEPAKLLASCGLDAAGITASIRKRFLGAEQGSAGNSFAKLVA